jgi:hypothetical protein
MTFKPTDFLNRNFYFEMEGVFFGTLKWFEPLINLVVTNLLFLGNDELKDMNLLGTFPPNYETHASSQFLM